MAFALSGPGKGHLKVYPGLGFITAVGASAGPFDFLGGLGGFLFFFGFFHFNPLACNFHFRFISAIFTGTDLFVFLFSHLQPPLFFIRGPYLHLNTEIAH
tara:strand:- start:1 stop:300 length:300 start_codon:yes stop_codon:yes gene_type:complete